MYVYKQVTLVEGWRTARTSFQNQTTHYSNYEAQDWGLTRSTRLAVHYTAVPAGAVCEEAEHLKPPVGRTQAVAQAALRSCLSLSLALKYHSLASLCLLRPCITHQPVCALCFIKADPSLTVRFAYNPQWLLHLPPCSSVWKLTCVVWAPSLLQATSTEAVWVPGWFLI